MEIWEQKANVTGKRTRGAMLTAEREETIYRSLREGNTGYAAIVANTQTSVSPSRGLGRLVPDCRRRGCSIGRPVAA